MTFTLHHGDAVAVMRAKIAPRSIDMVYADPPFGNEQNWQGSAGTFSDKWKDSDASEEGWSLLRLHHPCMISGLHGVLTKSARAYLGTMARIIVEAHRTLKPTGSFWLHCDDTANSELRIICELVFGLECYVGGLVWRRTHGMHANAKSFGRVHDTIICFARSPAAFWRLWRIGTIGGDPMSRKWPERFHDFAKAEPLASSKKERVGYPTQKPIGLLTELIAAATLRGDIVLDPTCGSGTTLVAATRLGRTAIGIDASADAITASQARLKKPNQTDLFGEAA